MTKNHRVMIDRRRGEPFSDSPVEFSVLLRAHPEWVRVTSRRRFPIFAGFFFAGFPLKGPRPASCCVLHAVGGMRSGFARSDSINLVTYSGDFVLRATNL